MYNSFQPLENDEHTETAEILIPVARKVQFSRIHERLKQENNSDAYNAYQEDTGEEKRKILDASKEIKDSDVVEEDLTSTSKLKRG